MSAAHRDLYGVVVVVILYYYPDVIDRTFN